MLRRDREMYFMPFVMRFATSQYISRSFSCIFSIAMRTYAIFNCLTSNHIMLYVQGTRYLKGLDPARAAQDSLRHIIQRNRHRCREWSNFWMLRIANDTRIPFDSRLYLFVLHSTVWCASPLHSTIYEAN